ncbi:MAG TPA: hypothetical protein VNZ26_23515 [Vicinamibacterales bacterium]|jgi:hypothetical protein|nr:hypothetical protein [Vicinamibacterales bacterium]
MPAQTSDAAAPPGSAITSRPDGGTKRTEGSTRPTGLQAVDRLRAESRRLVRRRSRAVDTAGRELAHAETLDFIVAELQRALASDLSGHIGAIANDAIRRARAVHRRSKSYAGRVGTAAGVDAVDIRPRPGGGALVRVADSKCIELAPALARLLWVLVRATAATDGFCDWQSFETVAAAIAQKGGPKPTRRAITQLVFRLRNLLEHGHADRWLVQVDQRLGLRFLVRKRDTGDAVRVSFRERPKVASSE